uniref:BRCA2 DNA repair associated n=1 Tax=Salvator merianae TaxID=96440 RepID=A0A8D0DQU1_SALMN
MDKKNVATSRKKLSFFEIFKAQCSESDLGPIGLNWFEELSSEAPLYDSKKQENPEHKIDSLDQSIFKTPNRNLSTSNQFVSTPAIFKEHNKTMQFVSPVREWCKRKSETVLSGGVLHTPKLFEVQTQICISESLGAEADPDMSWSSSLATPPTLSPTVIIAKGSNLVSEKRQHNERIESIMHSLIAKYGTSPKNKKVNVQSASRLDGVCTETESSIHDFEWLLDGSFGKSILPNMPREHQQVSNAPKDVHVHDGMDSDFAFLRKLQTAKQSKKTSSDQVEHHEFQKACEDTKDFKEKSTPKYVKECDSLNPNDRVQTYSETQKTMQREEEAPSLLSPWTQLSLTGLEITQLERESLHCSGSSTSHGKKNSNESLTSFIKDCATTKTLESCIQNAPCQIKRPMLLNISSPEEVATAEKYLELATITSKKDPALVTESGTNQTSVSNLLESSSFLVESPASTELSSSDRHNYLRGNYKACADTPTDSISTGLGRSGLKAMSSLSSLRRRPRKFIYSINNTSACQDEQITQRDSAPVSSVPACIDLKSCPPKVGETGRREGPKDSSINKNITEEIKQTEFEKNCINTNIFFETLSNETSSTENSVTNQRSSTLSTDSKKETMLLSNDRSTNQEAVLKGNKRDAVSHTGSFENENEGRLLSRTNFSSLQKTVLEESMQAMQMLETGRELLEFVEPDPLTKRIQVAEPACHSNKTLTTDSDKHTVSERKTDLKLLGIKEHAANKQEWLDCASLGKNKSFGGFKMASNKEIELSDNSIRKGKLIFKDIEDTFLEDISKEKMEDMSNQVAQEKVEISSVRRNKLTENPSDSLQDSDLLVNVSQLNDAQSIFPEGTSLSFQNVPKNEQPEDKHNLTASQEAEITELSNILEETGSQFEFTQFRNTHTCEMSGSSKQNDVFSEARQDADYQMSFERKVERNSLSPAKQTGTTEKSKMQMKGNKNTTPVNSSGRKLSKTFALNVSAPLSLKVSESEGCGLVKEINATINKSSKLISGLHEMLNHPSEIVQNSSMFHNCYNNPNNPTELCVNWHQRVKAVNAQYIIKNNIKDRVTFVKEDTEEKSKGENYNEGKLVHISSTREVNLKIVQKYSVLMARNELPSAENNHSMLVSHHFNCGETQCNLETLSDLTCLAEMAKTEEKSILNNATEKGNLSTNQAEENTINLESDDLLQDVCTVADGNISAEESKTHHFVDGYCIKELDSSSFSKKAGDRSKKGAISTLKTSANLSAIEPFLSFSHREFPADQKENQFRAIGFSTASGKQITVSDESLTKAKNLLSEETAFQASVEEKRNEKIIKTAEKLKSTEKCVAIPSEDDFEGSLSLLSDATKQYKNPNTVKEYYLGTNVPDLNVVFYTSRNKVNEALLPKNYLENTEKKNAISKTVCINSGTDWHLSDEESSGICVKQDAQLSAGNNSNIFVTSNSEKLYSLDLNCNTGSKTSKSDLKHGNSELHHLPDLSGEQNLETVTHISEDLSKTFIAENAKGFEETSKSEEITQKYEFLGTNTLQQYLASEAAGSALAKPLAFSTASGKTVRVSQAALNNVKQLIHKDGGKSIKQNMEFQSKTNKRDLSKNPSVALSRECVASDNYLWAESLPMVNLVTPQISRANESCENEPIPCSSKKLYDIKSDSSLDNTSFFKTASGKRVQLSEESLKKARLLFSETENSTGHQNHISDCNFDENSSVRRKLPEENKLNISPIKDHPRIQINSNIPHGFSTAYEKQDQISQKSFQKIMSPGKKMDNSFFVDHQGLGQHHILPKKTQAAKDEGKDEVISESNVCLTISNSSENKNSDKTLSTRKSLYMSHKEKCNRLANLEKGSLYSKDIKPFERHQPYPNKTKSTAKCDAVKKENLDSYHYYPPTSENYLEIEAKESAKAFMKDDNLATSDVQQNKKRMSSDETCTLLPFPRTGKRCMEKESTFGEPPIKRKLLPEFDRSEALNKSSLKASKCTPEDTVNDRKRFNSSIPLVPVFCGPSSSTEGRQETLNPNLTIPDQYLKESESGGKLNQFSSGLSYFSAPFSKTLTVENEKAESYSTTKKHGKVFIPPFKTKSSGSESKGINSESALLNGTEELNPAEVSKGTIKPETDLFEKHDFDQISSVNSEGKNTSSDIANIKANLQYARNLQEMRILKKQRQRIRPQPGSLYLVKTSATPKIPLKVAVEDKFPGSFSHEQLYTFGISKEHISINSKNAENFQFLIQDFFSKEYFLETHGIQLADGGYLVPNDEGKAGKEEFYRALCDTPSVDPKLISEAWVYNHYRWIIWKLAAMEVAFPQKFANKCLTPEKVLLQLKYRYDVEVDKSCRSAIKRITERDDVAAKTLILCISKVISLSGNMSNISADKNAAEDNKKEGAVVEVTDGWYAIKAVVDPPLKSLLCRKKLTIGQKIVVHGAELIGSQDASSPLEAPESLMLKISANSTRRARWYARLGYHSDPRPFTLPLSSLFSDGGTVSCIDVVIQRVYPMQWMEKVTGSFVFRNCRAEERQAAKHAENRQKTLETLLAKIQAEFEKTEDDSRRVLQSRILTRQQIRSLQDGAELYEALLNAVDPVYMESYFSEEQLKALNNHRQMINDKKQALIQAEFNKAVESAEQEEYSSLKRDVTTVMKVRILDYRKEENGKDAVLNIWRPSSHVCTLLKEGGHYRIFHLAAFSSKGKLGTACIQLTATKRTQYQQLPVSQELLLHVYRPRECLRFDKLFEPSFHPAFSEVDLVGYIVSLRKGVGCSTMMYLSDENYKLIVVKISTDLKELAAEDLIIACGFISATNLQWRPEFRSEIPILFSGEFSAFTSNPKESHLQGKFNELKNAVENNGSFGKEVQRKLMDLLQRDSPQVLSLPKEYGFDPFTWKSDEGSKHSIIGPKNEPKHDAPVSIKITPELQENPKTSKKRKAMDMLCEVPSPPPLKPICTFISPSLKRAFQPPRRSGAQQARSLKITDSDVKKSSLRRLNEAGFSLENNFIADEELAMINTQALLSNFPAEKEVDSVDKAVCKGHSDSPERSTTFQTNG